MSTMDLDAIRDLFARYAAATWDEDDGLARDLAVEVPALIAEVERLRGESAGRLDAIETMTDNYLRARAEVERLRAVVDRVRALHSPEPGWEREWAYPEHALANGWPRCAGCLIEGVAHREIGDCPTLRALDERATGEDGTRDG